MEERRKPRSFKSEKGEGRREKGEGRREKGEGQKGRRAEGQKGRRGERSDERKPRTFDRPARSDERKPRSFDRPARSDERKPRSFDRPARSDERKPRSFDRHPKPDTPNPKPRTFDRPARSDERKPRTFDRPARSDERKPRSFDRHPKPDTPNPSPRTRYPKSDTSNPSPRTRKRRDVTAESEILSEIVELRRREGRSSPKKQKILTLEHEEKYGPIRLNKYISNSGICSRRDADMLIQTGAIQVNGQIVTELGTKVMPTDEVRYGDKILQREKPVYLLLNKPKDYITTMEDERDRKHVLQLVKGACPERIYPVGRLDKNTTGLLLFTNDGEMTKKLTHPKHGIRKVYYVELNKNLAQADFEQIANGIELSDGEIKVDEIAYAGETKREIGITLHSGRNRIVRRIFEQLGYEVVKLDRVVFAGLTKKDLPRGKFRFLTDAELNILKMIAK